MYRTQLSIDNIPFGSASSIYDPAIRVATRFEDFVIFLDELATEDLLLELVGSTIDTFSQVCHIYPQNVTANNYLANFNLSCRAAKG